MKDNKVYRIRVLLLCLVDCITIAIASFLALYIRYDFKYLEIKSDFLKSLYTFTPFNIVMGIFVYFLFKLYSSMWKYASIDEVLKIIEAGITMFVIVIMENGIF